MSELDKIGLLVERLEPNLDKKLPLCLSKMEVDLLFGFYNKRNSSGLILNPCYSGCNGQTLRVFKFCLQLFKELKDKPTIGIVQPANAAAFNLWLNQFRKYDPARGFYYNVYSVLILESAFDSDIYALLRNLRIDCQEIKFFNSEAGAKAVPNTIEWIRENSELIYSESNAENIEQSESEIFENNDLGYGKRKKKTRKNQ